MDMFDSTPLSGQLQAYLSSLVKAYYEKLTLDNEPDKWLDK
jgi:hypothetical protein